MAMFCETLRHFVLVSVLLLTAFLPLSGADRIKFQTGETLEGNVVKIEGGIIHFDSDALGILEIPATRVELIILEEDTSQDGELLPEEDERPAPSAGSLPAAGLSSEEEPAEARPPWRGQIDFGYTLHQGRTRRQEIAFRGRANRQVGANQYRATAEYIYGKQNGSKSTDRYGGEFRWRHALTENLFSQTISLYESDRVRRIDHRFEQNISLGYTVLDTDRLTASVGPGFTIQYNQASGENNLWNGLATFFQDLRWQISPNYRIEEDSTFLIDPTDGGNHYIYRLNTAFVSTRVRGIVMSIRYSFIYENEPAKEVDRIDHRLVTSIGYAF
ncbi:MAG: DUF481 domain-containing protein [Opitutales bacterium]